MGKTSSPCDMSFYGLEWKGIWANQKMYIYRLYNKTNYRPVNILTVTSKNYVKILSQQLSAYFENIFDKYLYAFRKGKGFETVLLRLLEDWRAALDNNEYVAAVLMDLSKAFDCLTHKILLSKLSAYGLFDEAVLYLKSYLPDRKQRIKLNNNVSSWSEIRKEFSRVQF